MFLFFNSGEIVPCSLKAFLSSASGRAFSRYVFISRRCSVRPPFSPLRMRAFWPASFATPSHLSLPWSLALPLSPVTRMSVLALRSPARFPCPLSAPTFFSLLSPWGALMEQSGFFDIYSCFVPPVANSELSPFEIVIFFLLSASDLGVLAIFILPPSFASREFLPGLNREFTCFPSLYSPSSVLISPYGGSTGLLRFPPFFFCSKIVLFID